MNNADTDPVGRAAHLAALVTIAIRVLSARTMTMLMLAIDAVAFGFAIYSESWIRLAGATVLAAVAWGTVNVKMPTKEDDHGT
jgi:hypothetical protein